MSIWFFNSYKRLSKAEYTAQAIADIFFGTIVIGAGIFLA
jgi:hypothetical protein